MTILKLLKGREQNFEIMSTKGDQFLGGEDFDNKLDDMVLDRFCHKMKKTKKEIEKDKKCMKRLKISREKIKTILSLSFKTNLFISNFYKGNDIFETITRNEFEEIWKDLFERLKALLEEAVEDAYLNKKEINEIVLVGHSIRIPKIKIFLREYFNIPETNKNKKIEGITRINNSINPEETIAYGATIMAVKILFIEKNLTPLSLGINVSNKSTVPKIKKKEI